MASLFCSCLRSRQAAQLADSLNRAEDTAKKETVQFNKGIQQSLINKVAKKDLDVPHVFAGRHPKTKFKIITTAENDDTKTIVSMGEIHFQCATACENHTTCNGEKHNVVGSYTDGQTGRQIEITQGSWSPAGYCFWMEKETNQESAAATGTTTSGNDGTDDEETTSYTGFVIHDFANAEDDCQTVLILKSDGSKKRISRTFELLVPNEIENENNPPQPLCPSVNTVLDLMKHEK